jgi:nucleotide-binding universal stress UspA family protein
MISSIEPARAPHTIVLGYEETPAGRDALREARRLARPSAARIIAVAVYEGAMSLPGGFEDWEPWLRQDAERSVEGLKGVEPRVIASHTPAEALLEVIRDESADLVVVGSSHRARKGQVVPGSVGSRLIAEAPCAVIVAPAGNGAHSKSRSLAA